MVSLVGLALLGVFLTVLGTTDSVDSRGTLVAWLILIPPGIGTMIGFFRAGARCLVGLAALVGLSINAYVVVIAWVLLVSPSVGDLLLFDVGLMLVLGVSATAGKCWANRRSHRAT